MAASGAEEPAYDYLICGGGTAGAVVAARLSEDPCVTVGLLEWGPNDQDEPKALYVRRWGEMLEGEYDLDYRSVQQPRGNAADFDDWAARGASGWGSASMEPWFRKLAINIVPVARQHRNAYLTDVIEAASAALQIPAREDWNSAAYSGGAGFLPIGYYPDTGVRSSSSVAYLHPILKTRRNLEMHTRTRVLRVNLDSRGFCCCPASGPRTSCGPLAST